MKRIRGHRPGRVYRFAPTPPERQPVTLVDHEAIRKAQAKRQRRAEREAKKPLVE